MSAISYSVAHGKEIEKNRQDRKNTVNKTVYYGNAADSQEITSSDAALLLEKNRQDRKNTVNETVYRNTADSQESTSSDVALLSEKNRQDRKNTLNETVWRHDQVLRVLACTLEEERTKKRGKNRKGPKFIGDWNLRVDLDRRLVFPEEIASTNLKPDVVLWSTQTKQIVLVELTVPWEERIEEAYERKALKYQNLLQDCVEKGDSRSGITLGVEKQTEQVETNNPLTGSTWPVLSPHRTEEDVPTEDNYTLSPDSSEVIAISCTATSVSAKNPTVLSCDYCQLVQLPTIDDENITKLSLIWNNITDISNLPYLPKVVTIDMNHNLITSLRWHWLTNAPCLEHLDLSYNRIVRVSGSAQTTSVDQSTFSTVSIAMTDTLEEEQDMIIPIAAAVSGTMFMIAALALSLWGRRRRLQRQRAQALQQVLQARHSLLHNQMYGMDSNQQQLDNRAAVPNQAGCAGIQPYAEVALSKIEDSTSQDCDTNHTYTYIKDDVHSARQLVEANQHGDEQGRYETIPNELGCTGVEPYAEIPLSNIAVEPVMAEVECHARDKGKDTNIETSSLQPSVSDSRLVIEEIGTSQTPGLLDISHGVFQMETVPKGTHVPVATVTDNEMTDVSEEGGSAVQSTSNETVYQNAADSQESTASGVASLSEKNRQDRKNTVNKTVYYGNAADSQESTSSDAALLLEKNRQDRKNTVNETVYRNTADSQESTSSDVALLSEKNRQDRKNTLNETVYRNAADSQESTSREAVLLSEQTHQDSQNTENGAYCAT
ncbi:Transcriptional adapter 1 [Branchiostoma belcheri]|nr:Transcriptional adapter 1 [Branchiostoma belcheri]